MQSVTRAWPKGIEEEVVATKAEVTKAVLTMEVATKVAEVILAVGLCHKVDRTREEGGLLRTKESVSLR